ncbi:hypothetical protein CFN78_01935 [Amycolatopsis antarctica]|uniref:SH3 domain-containing protein n=1 Tax=Amycolatopsis antarctica TaxID=1854586 RepID=A0A263DCQ9_9PSEU|nr:hypothetical protein CFN78_01935 [Amycolatopsis antarctica]
MLGVPKKVLVVAAIVVAAGWMYLQGGRQESGAAEGGPPSACRMTVDADVLNVRSASNAGAEIVGKLKQDAETNAEPLVENGFRKLAENRWAAEEFLVPVAQARC